MPGSRGRIGPGAQGGGEKMNFHTSSLKIGLSWTEVG